jgi:hypothetical protein
MALNRRTGYVMVSWSFGEEVRCCRSVSCDDAGDGCVRRMTAHSAVMGAVSMAADWNGIRVATRMLSGSACGRRRDGRPKSRMTAVTWSWKLLSSSGHVLPPTHQKLCCVLHCYIVCIRQQ